MMRRLPIILFCLLLFAPFLRADTPPSSPRSRAAVERVRSRLETDLRRRGLAWGRPVFIRIFKESRELELWVAGDNRYILFRTFPVCRVSGALGPKTEEGDGQAPEGFYSVTASNLNPWSSYHLAMNMGYPNALDRELGRTGGSIMIHGGCVSTGCFAMTDEHIEEIFALVEAALRAGQLSVGIHVFPFRMTRERWEDADRPRLLGLLAPESAEDGVFWRNLKEGYELFERTRVPPRVSVRDGRYIFRDGPIRIR